jgi:hypothetical protein
LFFVFLNIQYNLLLAFKSMNFNKCVHQVRLT